MSIHFHSSVIFSKNVQGLAAFYRDVMAQDVKFDFGSCVSFTCGLSIWHPADGHPITVARASQNQGNGGFELCFETENFDDVVRELERHQVSFLHGVQKESWGQYTVRFFDPEQNFVELGESIPCFVRRLHHEGNSFDEISAQTSVPLAHVIELCNGIHLDD